MLRSGTIGAGLALMLVASSASTAGAEGGLRRDPAGDAGTAIDVRLAGHRDTTDRITYGIRAAAPIACCQDSVSWALDLNADGFFSDAFINFDGNNATWACTDPENGVVLQFSQPRPKILVIAVPRAVFDACTHGATYSYVVSTFNSVTGDQDFVPNDGTAGDGIQHTITT
jgi:hypothetical protein